MVVFKLNSAPLSKNRTILTHFFKLSCWVIIILLLIFESSPFMYFNWDFVNLRTTIINNGIILKLASLNRIKSVNIALFKRWMKIVEFLILANKLVKLNLKVYRQSLDLWLNITFVLFLNPVEVGTIISRVWQPWISLPRWLKQVSVFLPSNGYSFLSNINDWRFEHHFRSIDRPCTLISFSLEIQMRLFFMSHAIRVAWGHWF